MPRKRSNAKSNAKAGEAATFELPQLPSLLTQPLGLEGWTSYEPILLAALASAEPLILIGPHGSAKSFLLERLAQVLNLEYRFYNASLINYDDLVGIPIPDENRRSLKYISTPSAIWDAEVVFFDEINRTRPDLQNKLFPIIHERRVQGILLEKLQYRWAAMNPAPDADGNDEAGDVYLGAEPLDPSLTDRFSFLVEVPSWQNLTEEEKRRIFRDQFKGEHSFPVALNEMVALARDNLRRLQMNPPRVLEDYLLNLLGQLESNKICFSTRRATMLHRNILSVQAARIALYRSAFPHLPSQLTDWRTSALIALQNSLPQTGEGRKPDPALILAAHRHAWQVSELDNENPWRILFQIQNPFERCLKAVEMDAHIDDGQLSELILDGLGSEHDKGARVSAALAIYLALHHKRDLRATVYETLAQELRDILRPGKFSQDAGDCPRERYNRVKELCGKLHNQANDHTRIRNSYAANLLKGLLPDGYETLTPKKVCDRFVGLWDRFQITCN